MTDPFQFEKVYWKALFSSYCLATSCSLDYMSSLSEHGQEHMNYIDNLASWPKKCFDAEEGQYFTAG